MKNMTKREKYDNIKKQCIKKRKKCVIHEKEKKMCYS